MIKRIIAGVLSASLIVSAAVTGKLDSLVAEQNTPSSGSAVKSTGLNVEGRNSLGKMIGDAYSAQQAEAVKPLSASASELTFEVSGLEFDRDTGKVTVSSTQGLKCDILVSFIDDDNKEHVISIKQPVDAGIDTVTELDAAPAGLPEYFSVKAVLVDNSGKELSEAEYFNQYTRFIQEVSAATVEDFNEDFVVNLDDDDTTNFFVLNEDTIIAESSDTVNTLVSADYETNTFVFDNADETILCLKAGEHFYASPNENDIIAVTVESVENTAEGTVIKGSDDSDDIFDFVKIEVDEGDAGSPAVVDEGEEKEVKFTGYEYNEDGLLFNYSSEILSDKEEESKFSLFNILPLDIEKEIELEHEFAPSDAKHKFNNLLSSITGLEDPLATNDLKAEFGVSLKIALQSKITFYKFREKTELAIDGSLGTTIKFYASANYSDTQEPLGDKTVSHKDINLNSDIKDIKVVELPELYFPIFKILNIGINPEISFGFGGSVSASFSFAIDFSIYYNSTIQDFADIDSNLRKFTEADSKTEGIARLLGDTKTTLAANGNISVSFDPNLGIWPISEDIGGLYLGFPITLNLAVSSKVEESWSTPSEITYRSYNTSNPVHYCYPLCFSIKPSISFAVTVKARLIKIPPFDKTIAEKTFPLGEWFYSPFADGQKFGKGSCPHKSKLVTIDIKGNTDYHASDLQVVVDDDFIAKPSSYAVVNGKLSFYSKSKGTYDDVITHKYVVKSGDDVLAEGTFTVLSNNMVINVKITKTKKDDSVPIEQQSIEDTEPVTEAPTTEPYTPPKKAHDSITGNRKMISMNNLGKNVGYSLFTEDGIGYMNITGYGDITGSLSTEEKSKINHVVFEDDASYIAAMLADDELVIEEYIRVNRAKLIADYKEKNENTDIQFASDRDKLLREFLDENIAVYQPLINKYKEVLLSNTKDLTIKSISEELFAECENLETVILPAYLESIGSASFKGCTKLRSVSYEGSENVGKDVIDLPSSLKSIGFGAFESCSSLKGEVTLGTNIEYVGSWMFEQCPGITKISVLNPLCDLSNGYEFAGCSSLEELIVPSLCKNFYFKFTASTSDLPKLKKITVLRGTEVPGDALNGFDHLESIILPADIETIEGGAFANCTSLKSITYAGSKNAGKKSIDLPPTVRSIGKQAFTNCSSLTGELILSENIQEIYPAAFSYCSGITKVVIPNPECVMPESHHFEGCTSLEEVTVPSVCDKFYNKFKGPDMPVPATLKKMTILSGSTIPSTALEDFNVLETVILPADVEVIESFAFKNCTNLKKITYKGSENKAENVIDLPATIKSIGSQAFAGCENFERLIIPEGVTSISGYLVIAENCINLNELYLPKSLKFVDENTFGSPYNPNFGTVYYSGSEEDWNSIEILENNDAILKDKNTNMNIVYNYKPESLAVSTKPGDVNGDGVVNVADAVAVLQYIANQEKYPLSEQGIINADIDGSPGITGLDVIAIQKIDAGVLVIE